MPRLIISCVLGALAVCLAEEEKKPEKTDSGVICPEGFVVCNTDNGGSSKCCSADYNVTHIDVAPQYCPPVQLFTQPLGSIICETKCVNAENCGRCNINGNKVAVDPHSWRAPSKQYEVGGPDNDFTRGCYIRYVPGCVFSTTRETTGNTSCGFSFTPNIYDLGDMPAEGAAFVKKMNDSMPQFLKISIVDSKDSYSGKDFESNMDVEKAKAIIKENKNLFTEEAREKYLKGKKLVIKWGVTLTSWSQATHDETFTEIKPPLTKLIDRKITRKDQHCYTVAVDSVPKPYSYEDVSIKFSTCLVKCGCPETPEVPGCSSDYECAGSTLSANTMLAMVTTLLCLAFNW